MTLKHSSRNGAPILWVCGHSAEAATNKESLFRYFGQPHIRASSHAGIDAEGIADGWVDDKYAAWTLRNGNPYSLNVELCAFARWRREQWLSTKTVDGCKNPRQIVRNFAYYVVQKAKKYGIPLQRLNAADIRGRKAKGVIDHDDYTDATGDGSHWDLGEGFPWDIFWSDVRLFMDPKQEAPEVVTQADIDKIAKATAAAVLGYENPKVAGVGDRDVYQILVDITTTLDKVNRYVKPLDDWDNKDEWQADVSSAIRNKDLPAIKSAVDELKTKLDAIISHLSDPKA